uniref:Cyclin dependent kinase 2 associated protein 2 n=1 Tax=Canis lupus dingo TaxID=286419 RepID=A0A8C0JL00_CANLU
ESVRARPPFRPELYLPGACGRFTNQSAAERPSSQPRRSGRPASAAPESWGCPTNPSPPPPAAPPAPAPLGPAPRSPQAMKPPGAQGSQSTYTDLLSVIEEMGKEIRPTYAGSKSAMERLKRGIIHARALVRECLAETERNART